MNTSAGQADEPTLAAIFRQEIVPNELDGPEPDRGTRPQLLIRTGQPGADLATPQRIDLLDDRWAVDAGYVIVPSLKTLESYHPDWIELHDAALDGGLGAEATLAAAARWWQDTALEWARAKGCHTYLKHLPPQDPGRLEHLAQTFNLAGYDVHLVVAAVPAALSALAAMEYGQFATASGLRGAVPTGHALAHRAVQTMVKTAESCRDVQRITVVSRDGMIDTATRDRTGHWDRPGASNSAERARQHTFSDVECVALANRVLRVLDILDDTQPGAATLRTLGQEVTDNLTSSDGGLADNLGEFRAQRALLAQHGIGTTNTLDLPPPSPELGPEP